ncbi:MAG: hypothetical protein QXU40_02010 [Candidatus Pacearchaeota archaeon]
MKKIGKVLSNNNRIYILVALIILLIIVLFVLLKPKPKKSEKKEEKVMEIEPKKEYYGKIIKSNNGYIIKNKIKEKPEQGSLLPKDSIVVTEDKPMEISNNNSQIFMEQDTKIYVSDKGVISIKKGAMKIKGEIKLVALKYYIYGNGEVSVKAKDNEIFLSTKKGEITIVISKEKKIILKEGEGTIITPEEIEEPFQLPKATDIKVKVY